MTSKPEDRYINLEIKTLKSGQQVYKPCIPGSVIPSDQDPSLSIGDGDRADILAQNAFGDSSLWWKIMQANAQVNGTLHFKPGSTIKIPINE